MSRRPPTAPAAEGRGPTTSNGFVRLDREYLLAIRPHLTDRESRVYEAVLLECDGWDRPTNAAELARITRLHIDHVRKALRWLEAAGLIEGRWIGPRTSPYAKRTFTILRAYGEVLSKLRALGRIGPETLGQISPETAGQIGPETQGRISPETVGQIGPPHLRSRSSLDPPRSLPSSPPPSAHDPTAVAAGGPPTGGTNESAGGSVVEELVDLARQLWSTDVTRKGARRYLVPLVRIGDPVATPDELKRFLRLSAKSARVQRARFPIAAACMPEEFEDWMHRIRTMRLLPQQPRAAPLARTHAIPLAELAQRSAAYARDLATPNRTSTSHASHRVSRRKEP